MLKVPRNPCDVTQHDDSKESVVQGETVSARRFRDVTAISLVAQKEVD
jgi:hypothetical protein